MERQEVVSLLVVTYSFIYCILPIDITQTDSYQDATQKDFDSLVQMIAMFSQVIISNDPVNVSDLNANGAPTLTGAGYVFKFAVEHPDVFNDGVNPIGKLISSMDGVVLNGGTIATTGSNKFRIYAIGDIIKWIISHKEYQQI